MDKILNIFVIGHSLSKVDYPYFEEIIKHNKGNAFWHFGDNSLGDLKCSLSFAENIKIEKTCTKCLELKLGELIWKQKLNLIILI